MSGTTTTEFSTPFPVPPDCIDGFRRDGHVIVRNVISSGAVERSRASISRAAMAHNTEIRPLEERDTYGKAFLQVHNLWCVDDEVAAFVLAPRFGAIAAELLGVERVRLYHDQALFKEAGGGKTPWHQDASYWPLDGGACLTMWMPLTDLEPDMGGMVFASGTGNGGPLTDELISDDSEQAFDALLARTGYTLAPPVAMRAGDASFHLGWTAHKALANRSERMREVMTIIWFADGLDVLEPASPAQQNDLDKWLPGCRPGEPAASHLNPLVDSPHG